MDTNVKSIGVSEGSPHIYIYSRIAGLVFVTLILLFMLSNTYVTTNILVDGNDAATVENIVNNEVRFRISLACEIAMYVFTVLLAYVLYVILKPVNKNLALLAMLWRIGEAIIGSVVALLAGLIPLLLLNGKGSLDPDHVQGLVGLFMQVRGPGMNIYMIFLGLGSSLFFYLFFISKYIPRILSLWGMIAYFSGMMIAFATMLSLDPPELIRMVSYKSVTIFEIVIGLWLLIMGVNIKKKKPAIATVTEEQLATETEEQIDAEILD
jgi:hypothetical protein